MAKLFLIDGHSILNRAYYGLPDLTNSEGKHTNAVYGFLNMTFRFLDEEDPDYFAVAFDTSAPTFRHEMFKEYKGTRHPMDPELKEQVPMIQEMLRAMGVPIIKKAGLEADDILGTLSVMGEKAGLDVTVMSGDRDLLQLATDHVMIMIPKTKKTGTEIETYRREDVYREKGVTPREFIEVKALMGDTSDNIPGVPGIGEKTAEAIIKTYHSIEEAHRHLDELKPPRARKNLEAYWDQALLSRKLSEIRLDCDLDFDLKDAKRKDLFTPEAYALCRKWEFKNFLPRFSGGAGKTDEDLTKVLHVGETGDLSKVLSSFSASCLKEGKALGAGLLSFEGKIAAFALSDGKEAYGFPIEEEEEFDRAAEDLDRARRKGILLSFPDLKDFLSLLPIKDASSFYDPDPKKETAYPGFFDTSVAAYLLNPLKKAYPMDEVAGEELSLMIPSWEDRFKKRKEKEIFSARDDETRKALSLAAAGDALVAAKAVSPLKEKLRAKGMLSLYQKIELPLIFTLSDMEKAGMKMDEGALKDYGTLLSSTITGLEEKIYKEAGETFNINSPKQLGEILFGKLGLPNGKKTKTGYSTAADVLSGLEDRYPIVKDVLTYRQYNKLKTTYVDGLSACLSPDGRVHSTFQQKVTATGRISSTEPNLQNIPVRMELGKKIRKVFYPEEGYIYLDADYSQIELRVLAHMSGDKNLIEAYREGKDIHRATAARVFHVPFDEVTDLQRRNAKAVNFGIVYGISAFGLAKDIHVSREEAGEVIKSYYEAFPTLRSYLDGLVASAREKGYSLTLYGRRRPIPELTSSNFMTRQFGERVAKNAPIQGTAADIIKIAMVRVHDRLIREGLSSRLLLQVHDELLIETKLSEEKKVEEILKEEMEGAADLRVKLLIDMHTGKTWYDAK